MVKVAYECAEFMQKRWRQTTCRHTEILGDKPLPHIRVCLLPHMAVSLSCAVGCLSGTGLAVRVHCHDVRDFC